jgi:hypothetical protein
LLRKHGRFFLKMLKPIGAVAVALSGDSSLTGETEAVCFTMFHA